MSGEQLDPRIASTSVARGEHERTLDERDVDPDPQRQFRTWLNEAIHAEEPMPNAMALATCSADGVPSARMVLLEEVDERGFAFQTNLDSPKAHDLAAVPRAAATFFWPRLVRQVRVSGSVQPLSREEMAVYFAKTPPAIQTMLRACRQGEVIPNRAALEASYAAALADGDTSLPDHWGGYRLSAAWIEFWQGRQNWLQDRLRYTREAGGGWRVERLAP